MPSLQELIQQKRNQEDLVNSKTIEQIKIDISNWGMENNFNPGIYRNIPATFGSMLHEWLMEIDVKNSLIYINNAYELHIDWTQKVSDEQILVTQPPESVVVEEPQPEPLPPEQA